VLALLIPVLKSSYDAKLEIHGVKISVLILSVVPLTMLWRNTVPHARDLPSLLLLNPTSATSQS
jgi:hypothetical protein